MPQHTPGEWIAGGLIGAVLLLCVIYALLTGPQRPTGPPPAERPAPVEPYR